ncbi:hypothetical protein [Haematobacter massiliensis]|uniref:hypothetical protein n=1 Tax=Haematobacter massiliensis TaxID=195105 RepID=UPI003BF992CA
MWYRDNLVGTEVVNADTGWTIEFQTRGRRRSAAGRGLTSIASCPRSRIFSKRGTGQNGAGRQGSGKSGGGVAYLRGARPSG